MLEKEKRVLARHFTVIAAAQELGLGSNTLVAKFKRKNDSAAKYLKKSEPRAPAAILEQAKQKRTETQLRAEHKAMAEQLEEAHRRTMVQGLLSKSRVPVIKPLELKSGMREGTAVVQASDWHFEEVVSREQACGLNEYDLSIARRRAERYFVGVQWLMNAARHTHKVRDVIVWLGGDLISGYIHEELVETNELSPVEACLEVGNVLFKGLSQLLLDPLTEKITVPCSYGNHGRTTPKKRIKTGAQNSYEWMMYNHLAQRFAGERRIEFVIDRSAHQFVDAYGFGLHFTHGDELKFGGGVGGLAIPLGKRVPTWDRLRPTAYHHIGHFHQCQRIGRTFCNGSLIGYNEYAVSIGAQYEPPMQNFYILDSKRGAQYMTNIWCDDSAVGKLAT